jgi:hypothetical protein
MAAPSRASGQCEPHQVVHIVPMRAGRYVPESDDGPVRTLAQLLEQEALTHLHALLGGESLAHFAADCEASRPKFLGRLNRLGVSKLADRQAIANAIARAQREGRLQPAPADTVGPSPDLATLCATTLEPARGGVELASEPCYGFARSSVRQLRELVRDAGLDHSDCVEKDQLISRAREAQAAMLRVRANAGAAT